MTTARIVDPKTPYHRLLRNPAVPRFFPVLGVLTILVGWAVAGIVFQSIQLAIRPDPHGTVSWFGLLSTNLTLASLILVSMLVAARLNRRPPGILSSVEGRLRWRLLATLSLLAIGVELVFLVGIKIGGLQLDDSVSSGPARDAVAVIAVTLLTSTFQAAGEEYFFRGYLQQAIGTFVRSPMVPILASTLLFAMAHGQLPWQSPALFLDRFAFGLVAAYLAVRTGGLEAPIAAHAANNVVTFVFAALTNTVGSSLGIDQAPWSLVVADVVKFGSYGVLVLLITRRAERRPGPERL